MQDKYILTTKNYEDWRNYLIVNSFFFEVLMRELRLKLGLPKNGIADLHEMIEWEANKLSKVREKHTPIVRGNKSGVRIVKELMVTEYATRKEAYAPLWEVLNTFVDLNLGYSLLHTYVLGLTGMSFPGSSRVFMITSPEDPIEEAGVYIKYTPELGAKDMDEILKHARETYNTFYTITHESKIVGVKSGNRHVKKAKLKIRQRKFTKPTDQQLKIYLEVENYLKAHNLNQTDNIKMQNVFDAVSKLVGINRDTLQRTYYAVIRNFQLPTSIDTKKISKLSSSLN